MAACNTACNTVCFTRQKIGSDFVHIEYQILLGFKEKLKEECVYIERAGINKGIYRGNSAVYVVFVIRRLLMSVIPMSLAASLQPHNFCGFWDFSRGNLTGRLQACELR